MVFSEEDHMLLAAYCDGELSGGEALAMERRLAAEPELRAMARQLEAFSGSIRKVLHEPQLPDALRDAIVRQFGAQKRGPGSKWGAWQSLAAAFLIGVLGGGTIGGGAVYLHSAEKAGSAVDAVLAGHLRSLAAPQPYDIASSDRHTVKPWFNGRTTIAPDAPDLADQGFPLAGGRVDIVDGTPVPTLVYRRRLHVISVTIVPRASEMNAAPASEHRNGTNIAQWSQGDLVYVAASDLNAAELQAFAALFWERTQPKQR